MRKKFMQVSRAKALCLLVCLLICTAWQYKAQAQEAYWQQKVHYRIKASLDDQKNILNGQFYELTYYNQSPHTLKELYFHLVWNAYTPNSPYHNLQENNDKTVVFGDHEAKGLGISVENVLVNGQSADTTSTNSILRVKLPEPLLSGDSVKVSMQFKTYFSVGGNLRKRMKVYQTHGYKNYNAVHWYPIVCVYDKHFAWETETELDKEYYADFGTFEVDLDLPDNYILDATGTPLNRQETLPDDLRRALDLSNYATKAWESKPSELMPKTSLKRKIWRFRADNVHNFAFTASPLYRIAETEADGAKVVVLVQEQHAQYWQQTPVLCANLIQFYNRVFGQYAYERIIFADAAEGTECAQMALVTGLYPNHAGLIAHELAHQWFQGMVGSNERYRAFLDEGFAEYATVMALHFLYGHDLVNYKDELGPLRIKAYPYSHRYAHLFSPYLEYFWSGHDMPLNTHSSDFRSAVRQEGGYGLVYQKGGLMLENLRYVLGDKLFFGAMRHYVNTWKFKHPYPEDFRAAVTAYTQTDLAWFFDQWLETDKYIDYGIKKVRRRFKKPDFAYEITFERKGSMQMPLDFHLWDKSGNRYDYHIPNKWFLKEMTKTKVLPQWTGWGKNLNPTYTTTLTLPKRIKRIEIDSSYTLADVDMRDNYRGKSPRSRLRLDIGQDLEDYTLGYQRLWQPYLFHSGFDGLRIGVQVRLQYRNVEKLLVKFWFNSTLLQYKPEWAQNKLPSPTGLHLQYSNRFSAAAPTWSYWADIWAGGGLAKSVIGLKKELQKRDPDDSKRNTLSLFHKYMRLDANGYFYLADVADWSRNTNSSVNFLWNKTWKKRHNTHSWHLLLRTPAMQSEFNYGFLSFERLWHKRYRSNDLRMRFYHAEILNSRIPNESLVYLASANPEQQADNTWTQTYGILKPYSGQFEHVSFQQGGGLNARGYTGATLIYTDSNTISTPYFRGRSGTSFSLEYGKSSKRPFWQKKWHKRLELDYYAFFDIAQIQPYTTQSNNQARIFANAGIGLAWRIKFPQTRYEPFVIRIDCPFWNSTNRADGQNFAFRPVIGIGRSF